MMYLCFMAIKVALILSVLLQFGASFLAFSLIRRTKFNISWIFISIGFFFMALRRLYELIMLFTTGYTVDSLISSWFAVLISLLMFIGTIYIRRIFDLQDKIDSLRKEQESKVLSAIIHTEEKERRSFAKEIHDGLGPILSAIKMSSTAIQKDALNKHNRKIFTHIESAIDEAIVGVKEISNNLSPHILEQFGIDKAVKSFINNLLVPKGMITYSSNLNRNRLPDPLEVILYRVIGELLHNTLKHAQADKVKISLFDDDQNLELLYTDDGIGFIPEDHQHTGMGLTNIRSRIASIQGELEIQSSPEEGFFFRLTVPIQPSGKSIEKR